MKRDCRTERMRRNALWTYAGTLLSTLASLRGTRADITPPKTNLKEHKRRAIERPFGDVAQQTASRERNYSTLQCGPPNLWPCESHCKGLRASSLDPLHPRTLTLTS